MPLPARRIWTIAGLLLVIALTVALAISYPSGSGADSGLHAVSVEVDGIVQWEGNGSGADPIEVLVDAAGSAHEIKVRGQGAWAYVWGIDGREEAAGDAGGWCYRVDDGSGWRTPGVGAGGYALSPGERVSWYWTDHRCEAFSA